MTPPAQGQSAPRVSIVVNTYNRCRSLGVTLSSFRHLDYANFEVVVVNGPSTDGTEELLAGYQGQIKVARCPVANLSTSRNIGIAVAAGEIVAFIDDDAYPDPAWLDHLTAAYDDAEVAAAGGPVYDSSGYNWQTRYIVSDRFGASRVDFETNRTGLYNHPYGTWFGRLIGTNSSFRRDRLLEIGGFDEAFDYFLDETDVCARLVDAGYVIRQLEKGSVYHKFLPNGVRGENRASRNRFVMTKNACYFALKNVGESASFYGACVGLMNYLEVERNDYDWNIRHGHLTEEDRARFEAELPAAFDAGFEQFQAGPKMRPREWFGSWQQPFLPFATLRPAGDKLHLCLVSQDYPPLILGGIGRVTHVLAGALAAAGHVVRVITRGRDQPLVDLEDGVWVHRIVDTPHQRPSVVDLPEPLWDHAASVLDELHRILAERPVDVVHAPNWDSEGLAVVLEGQVRCAVGLYTPVRTLQRLDPRYRADPQNKRLAIAERTCYVGADAVWADSDAVVAEIEREYDLRLDRSRVEVIPLGLPDWAGAQATAAPQDGGITILFVGRLEHRKGIDTLLACAPAVLDRFADATFVLIGQDDRRDPLGQNYRAAFESSDEGRRLAPRVRFLGPVPDEELLRWYATCDIFVAPSRFESFGLIAVEAMMFAKPVVSSRAGGLVEVVVDGETGLLVSPGDADELGAALRELCASAALRDRLGRRGREVYEERLTAGLMAERAAAFYQRVARRQVSV